MASTFVLPVEIPEHVLVQGHRLTREDFFAWIWREFQNHGLQGVHEGTLLSEDAVHEGLETTPWILDSGLAPEKRDWIGDQLTVHSELYFDSIESAKNAAEKIIRLLESSLRVGEPFEQIEQDWNAKWKASFQGAKVSPFWWILPPWKYDELNSRSGSEALDKKIEKILVINPGAGFGTGTHETTQLCLEVLGRFGEKTFAGKRFLDFGSGSGVLTIAAGILGSQAVGVEIDPLAIDNAQDNLKLNRVQYPELQNRITFQTELPDYSPNQKFDGIVANILKPILLEFSHRLVERLKLPATIFLSGLLEDDVGQVRASFDQNIIKIFGPDRVEQYQEFQKNEWRCLVWNLK